MPMLVQSSVRPIFGFVPSTLDETAVAARIAASPPFGAGPSLVVTPNLDHIVQYRRNPAFRAAYRRAAIILCDGFPVHYYARLRGHAAHRVTGSGLIARLMHHPDPAVRMLFVVDRPETAHAVETWAQQHGIAHQVATSIPPLGFIAQPSACDQLALAIAQHRPTLLVMGVGAPQSEIFIDRYHAALPDCWALCVGQGVKMALGLVRRAPPAVQTLHAEWLWRLIQEPRRLAGRYGLGAFRFASAIVADLRGRSP
ncbi:WecB/TagA/CpsF family glycosyltransferase [Acidiphilium sp. PA]|uniref:WecB/TagA/CpsF family glycosyltransferase n=1 Tax=Acidiphilium sp. PA TaxID=2871705 RepID=UPI002243D015|nr:WecB/TagA/CpsF family glycosyltransferase [Acidiphilium sp. PA]MCW8308623.1 WecB/TagA/CpsF family glycosyltransferase [Acidiphilium sp. PA]